MEKELKDRDVLLSREVRDFGHMIIRCVLCAFVLLLSIGGNQKISVTTTPKKPRERARRPRWR